MGEVSRWKHSILEVVESEKAYVKDLRTTIECFYDPLSAMFKVSILSPGHRGASLR